MVAANLVAVGVGRQVDMRLSPSAIRIASAILFGAAGVLVVATALAG